VTSRRPESRERFVAEMSEILGKSVAAVADVEAAVAGADIVIDASRLSEERTILENRWLEPGALVMPYGAVRSTDPELPLIAGKFVVDDWRQAAGSEHGQYYTLIRDGQLTRDHVYAEIGEIVAGAKPGRERDDELIVFWHRGFAISDIAVGSLALRRAQELGLGTRVEMASAVRDS
jgi:ornithine cyclodeaminase